MKKQYYPKLLHVPCSHRCNRAHLPVSRLSHLLLGLLLLGGLSTGISDALAQEPGVSKTAIRIGGVMALTGSGSSLGINMKAGIEAALKGTTVHDRNIEFTVLNDSYNPPETIEATRKLIDGGIFAMVGNTGSPTARVSVPILAEQKIPAVGFFTGADVLRSGVGPIINYRPSYAYEVTTVIDAAFRAGVKPRQVCAFVQNDQLGMSGITGFIASLRKHPEGAEIISKLEQILALPDDSPARNNIGPVGVYPRNTIFVSDGYKSIKQWEKTTGERCRLVATMGMYEPTAQFMAYARVHKQEPWIISTMSGSGAEGLKSSFEKYNIREGILMTQVVPALDSSLPIVESARKALGDRLGYISLEGYIVGKMFLALIEKAGNAPTRERLVEAARGQKFDLGGLAIDFTTDNQGSDLILMTLFQGDRFTAINSSDFEKLFTR